MQQYLHPYAMTIWLNFITMLQHQNCKVTLKLTFRPQTFTKEYTRGIFVLLNTWKTWGRFNIMYKTKHIQCMYLHENWKCEEGQINLHAGSLYIWVNIQILLLLNAQLVASIQVRTVEMQHSHNANLAWKTGALFYLITHINSFLKTVSCAGSHHTAYHYSNLFWVPVHACYFNVSQLHQAYTQCILKRCSKCFLLAHRQVSHPTNMLSIAHWTFILYFTHRQ